MDWDLYFTVQTEKAWALLLQNMVLFAFKPDKDVHAV
jgi:hypothetical protein